VGPAPGQKQREKRHRVAWQQERSFGLNRSEHVPGGHERKQASDDRCGV
jgi:hypothetical protein